MDVSVRGCQQHRRAAAAGSCRGARTDVTARHRRQTGPRAQYGGHAGGGATACGSGRGNPSGRWAQEFIAILAQGRAGVESLDMTSPFNPRDGSHLTDRTRVLRDTVNMKSRKTYARMHVGFVNVNANKAKCSLVTASRL